MKLKLTGIALAVAFAFAGTAQAQKSERKATHAEKEQIEAAYKADKAKCDGPSCLPLAEAATLLKKLKALHAVTQGAA